MVWLFQWLCNIPRRGVGQDPYSNVNMCATTCMYIKCFTSNQEFCWVHSDQVLVWGFLQTYKNVFSFQGFWFFQLQLRDSELILSCTTALIPHATLLVTFRLPSKTPRTADEILEFLRETKYTLNSQKIIFFKFYLQDLNVQTNHQTLDLPIMLNSVLSYHKAFLKLNFKREKHTHTKTVMLHWIITGGKN